MALAAQRWNLAFVAFPLLVSIRFTPHIELVVLAVMLVLALIGKPRTGDDPGRYVPMALLVVVCGLGSLVRGAPHPEIIGLVGAATAVVLAGRRATAEVAVRSLVAGSAVYLAANVFGWIAGVQSPAAAVRTGLLEGRVIFPFARSINEPSIVAAAFLAYVLVAWRKGRGVDRWVWLLGIPCALVIMAQSGSRFPVIVLALLVPGVLLWPRLARTVPTVGLAAMSLPFVFTALTPLITAIAERLAENSFVARGQSVSEIAGGSSRSILWSGALEFWGRVPSAKEHLIGYGYNGHVQSHVVYLFFRPGEFVSDPAALTLHNSFLQEMFDTGYVGLTALIVALWMIGRRFSRVGDLPTSTMIGVIYACCAVEVFMVPTFRTTPFLVVLALSVLVPGSGKQDGIGPRGVVVEASSSDARRQVAQAEN